MDTRKMTDKETVDLLNKIVECCSPIYYSNINHFILADQDAIEALEKEHDEVGVAEAPIIHDERPETPVLGITITSLIATITDCLVGRRLAVLIDADDGRITGFTWYRRNGGEAPSDDEKE
jgi:hypothetical protein